MKLRIKFFIVCFCLSVSFISAQEKSFVVLDAGTNNPVPFVNICIEKDKEQNYKVTDTDGRFATTVKLPFIIAISGIGYKTFLDTIDNRSDTVIFLNPAIFDIDEVVVTGQASPKRSDQSIYKVNVINRHEIEQKAATNLTGVLNNELSINVTQDGILGRTLSLRGLSGEHIKILIDGIPVVGRQNGIIDLDQLSLDNVDHIEIVEGPLSVIYGSNALGGVINIITRKKSSGKFLAGLNTYYESIGKYNVNLDFHYGVKKSNFNIYASRNFFSGFDPDKNSRFQLWKPKLQINPGISYTYSGAKINISSSVDFMNEELRDKDSLRFEEVVDRYYFTQRLNSSLNSTILINKESKIVFTAGYSYYRRIKNTYTVNLINLSKNIVQDNDLNDTTHFNLIFNSGSYVFSKNNFEILSGYDLNHEFGNGKRINGTKDISDYAFYANFIFSPYSRFKVQPGVRAAYNSKYKSPLVYSLNVSYNPGNFNFRASYGRGFRTPSLKELYLEFIDQNHRVYGNENLKAETSDNFNVSGRYIYQFGKNNIELTTDLFYNSIENKIDFIYNSSDALWAQYYNIADFKSKGTELELRYQFHPRFTFKTGIAVTGISSIGDKDRFVYNTDYTTSFNYKNLKYLFQLSAFFKYSGRKTFYKADYNLNEGISEITEEYINGYNNLDVTLSVPLFKSKINLVTGVKNVFNTVTVFSTGSPNVHGNSEGSLPVGWGRSYFVKLSYKFIRY